jgi:hypothetical protein
LAELRFLLADDCSFAHNLQDFDEAMKNFKSTEQEVGKKDKKLKDIENSKSAANQRSAIDTLSRQLQDERKVMQRALNAFMEFSTERRTGSGQHEGTCCSGRPALR